MPIPTWAVLIMLTSLAPSPIPNVVHLFFRISQTISCFCFGVTLQQMIALHWETNYNNTCQFNGVNKSYPVATRQQSLLDGYFCLSSTVAYRVLFQHTMAISLVTNPQLTPILIAVYFLSPVSIHTLTPASLITLMVSFTFYCSWSYIAVDPIKSNQRYSIFYNYLDEQVDYGKFSQKYFQMNIFCLSERRVLSLSSLFIICYGGSLKMWSCIVSSYMILLVTFSHVNPVASILIDEALLMRFFFIWAFSTFSCFYSLESDEAYIFAHFQQSFFLISLLANSNVLNPIVLHCYTFFMTTCSTRPSALFFTLSIIMLSAPLQYTNICSSFSNMTDILFLSESKSIVCSILYLSTPLAVFMQRLFYLSTPWNYQPQYLAKLMKASSSGEDALYFFQPVQDSQMITLWQRAKETSISFRRGGHLDSSPLTTRINSISWKSTFVILEGMGCGCTIPPSSLPQLCYPITIYLKLIQFLVNVPVLSENTCCICPSYQFKVDVCTVTYAGKDVMKRELLILIPCIYLTIYSETMREIGTKLVKSRIHPPHRISSSVVIGTKMPNCTVILGVLNMPSIDTMKVTSIWKENIMITMIPILNYNLDFLLLLLLLLSIILLSTPVYTTTPVTQWVIRSMQPRRIILLQSNGMGEEDFCDWQLPVNEQMNGLGLQQENQECTWQNCGQFGGRYWRWSCATQYFTCLNFRLVSPSRFLVYMKQFNFSYELCNRMISAGNCSFCLTLITSPMRMSFHLTYVQPPSFNTWALLLLISSSDLFLFKSQQKSLIAETETTIPNGIYMTGNPILMLMGLIICITPIIRKYILGNLENWIIKFNGIKSNILYLDVLMELLHTCVSGTLVIIDRLGIYVYGGGFLKSKPFISYALWYVVITIQIII